MDKYRVKGKGKDIAGRVQRQAGEWTGDEEQQVKGTAKQAEGKVQNLAGKVKDKARDIEEKVREGRPGRKRAA
jgi:uncharacterized protein YjbJ (UPF0337 family)